MRNKRYYYLFLIVAFVVATAICVYDVTQRYGNNNFGAFVSLLLALAFGGWSLHYSRKLIRYKAKDPDGR